MAKIDVLIVEDDLSISDAISSLLSMEGFAAYSACDGLEGLRFLENCTDDSLLPLVLLDMIMPVMGGKEFLDRFQRMDRYKCIKVVVISASRILCEEAARKYQVDQMIKPVEAEDIVKLAHMCCDPYEGQ